MLELTHDPLVGAGVDGAAVVGATVGAAVDGATVGAAVDGAAVDGAFSHSAPLNPGEQTQTFPLQLPLPEHTVVLLAGEALFGPEMLAATHDGEVGAGVVGAVSHSAPVYPLAHTQTLPLQLPLPEHTVVLLAGEALFGPEMLAATHDGEVGAGVSFTGGSVGAAVDGAAVVGATVGAAVVDSMQATSHSSPSKPALQTQVSPSQTPFPLQTVDCLSSLLKRLAGEALFGPEMFAEHEAEVLFALLPGVAWFGPEMFAPHWLVAFTAMMAANRAMSTIVLIICFCFVV
jgi:hypothetical protein